MLNSWPLAKDLQVLVEIVHSGSFSAAAATLGQTPAFVTKRIQILENTLATTLLNRSARGVALTESGQRCYEHALEILTQYQRLVDDVTQIKTRPEGMIRIGCSFGFAILRQPLPNLCAIILSYRCILNCSIGKLI